MYLKVPTCLLNLVLKEDGQRFDPMQVKYKAILDCTSYSYFFLQVDISSEIVIADDETRLAGWTLLSPTDASNAR